MPVTPGAGDVVAAQLPALRRENRLDVVYDTVVELSGRAAGAWVKVDEVCKVVRDRYRAAGLRCMRNEVREGLRMRLKLTVLEAHPAKDWARFRIPTC